MSKKFIFSDLNSNNKLELRINEQYHALHIKVNVPKKEENQFISSSWVSISYEDLEELERAIKTIKKEIESK